MKLSDNLNFLSIHMILEFFHHFWNTLYVYVFTFKLNKHLYIILLVVSFVRKTRTHFRWKTWIYNNIFALRNFISQTIHAFQTNRKNGKQNRFITFLFAKKNLLNFLKTQNSVNLVIKSLLNRLFWAKIYINWVKKTINAPKI